MKINFKKEIGKCLEEQFSEMIEKALQTKNSTRQIYLEEEVINYEKFFLLLKTGMKVLRKLEGGKNGRTKTANAKTKA